MLTERDQLKIVLIYSVEIAFFLVLIISLCLFFPSSLSQNFTPKIFISG
jgi:hypothetical protein